MADIIDSASRSRLMARIGSKNTKPETMLGKALFAEGLRYRKNVKGLPGSPDLVFRKFSAAVFVHGCFWHGHDCDLFRLPMTRPEFWSKKIRSNRVRDERAIDALREMGYRPAVVWECAIRGTGKLSLEACARITSDWIKSDREFLDLRGTMH